MQYQVIWTDTERSVFDSRFATWGDHVTDATLGLRWALGKSYTNTAEHIRSQGGYVKLINGTEHLGTLSGVAVTEVPKPTIAVITRTGENTADGD